MDESEAREEFTSRYRAMNEQELLGAAREYDTLVDTAQAALRAEFVRRNIEPPVAEDETVSESRRLVTVRRYRDLSEAIVARSMVESAGIRTYLSDENLIRLDWQLSNFIGGLRLQVDADDVETATELLSQPVPDSIVFEEGAEFEQPRCPRCGSAEITFEGASRGAALASLSVLSVPLPFGRETWTCSHCGARWEETEELPTAD